MRTYFCSPTSEPLKKLPRHSPPALSAVDSTVKRAMHVRSVGFDRQWQCKKNCEPAISSPPGGVGVFPRQTLTYDIGNRYRLSNEAGEMNALDVLPASADPRTRPRRGASAQSLLNTIIGEFVYPRERAAWTHGLVSALALFGIDEAAARQALARSAGAGLLEREQVGRRVRWR